MDARTSRVTLSVVCAEIRRHMNFSRIPTDFRIWISKRTSGTTFLMFLAVLVGLGGGFGAVGFRELISLFRDLFRGRLAAFLEYQLLFPLVPALGGLIVGFMVIRWAREAKGHGVPEVMAAVATNEGRIRPRVVLVKALASAVCIGSGGSVGREGPIVQIGSALGSTFGQVFGFTPQRMKILVACGSAAGISGTFNAPIAGVLFSLEIILGEFTITAFSPIIVSSVIATALSRYFLGDVPGFTIPEYETVSIYELGFYGILAVMAGLSAVGFIKLLYKTEDVFERIKVPDYLKPMIGGLIVGLLAIHFMEILGVGYGAITRTITGDFELHVLVFLFGAKLLATSVTLGSGGSGGIFAPSLFLGSILGAAFGSVVHSLFPSITAQPGAYALVGMGAMVAGTTHATFTSMLILFELTDDYKIILPLMLATTISTLVARKLSLDSIYTLKLSRRGLRIAHGIDTSVLESIKVREVFNPNYDSVSTSTTLGEIVKLIQHSEFTDFPVVDREGILKGMVTFHDVKTVMMADELYYLLVASDVMDTNHPTIGAGASLLEALHAFSEYGVQHLPVVEDTREGKLLGVLTRSRLMRRYEQELRKRFESSL